MTNELQPVHTQQPPDRPPSTPDAVLSEGAAEWIHHSHSDSTRRSYTQDWTPFVRWCTQQGRTPLPASAETLASYTDHLIATREPAPNTIDRILGTLASAHKVNGTPAPTDAARRVLRGYRKHWSAQGNRTKQATALTVTQLRAMVDLCDPETLTGRRNRTLLLLGFNLMARRSELAGLNIADLVETEQGMEVFIASSKTDQDATGEVATVPYGTHTDTCAVRTTRSWLRALSEQGITSGPVLRGVDRHGRITGTPGAAGRKETRMSGVNVNRIVTRLAEQAGLEGVTAHSLRAGPATSAAMAGVPRHFIARQGRWNPTSPTVDGYIRPADSWRDNPMRSIGL